MNLAHLWVNFWAYLYRGEGNVYFENLLLGLFPSLYGKIIQWIPKTLFAYLWLLLLSLGWASTFNRHFLHMLPTVVTAFCYFGWLWLRQQSMFPSMHYRLRSIEGGQFRLVNFASHFIRVQIFQIDFPLILYLTGTKWTFLNQACKPRSYASPKLCSLTYSQGLSVELLA